MPSSSVMALPQHRAWTRRFFPNILCQRLSWLLGPTMHILQLVQSCLISWLQTPSKACLAGSTKRSALTTRRSTSSPPRWHLRCLALAACSSHCAGSQESILPLQTSGTDPPVHRLEACATTSWAETRRVSIVFPDELYPCGDSPKWLLPAPISLHSGKIRKRNGEHSSRLLLSDGTLFQRQFHCIPERYAKEMGNTPHDCCSLTEHNGSVDVIQQRAILKATFLGRPTSTTRSSTVSGASSSTPATDQRSSAIFTLVEKYVLQCKKMHCFGYFRPHLGAVYFLHWNCKTMQCKKQNGCSGKVELAQVELAPTAVPTCASVFATCASAALQV